MALHPSTHAHSSTHASQASHAHAAHAASKAKPGLTAEDGAGGGFAAQLLKAQPAPDKASKAADTRPKADAAKKSIDDRSASDGAQAGDADGKDDRDARPAEVRAMPIDPAALLAAQQAIAPPTTSLADKAGTTADHDDFASDPLGALRKAAGKPGKDDGQAALLASLGGARPAPADASVSGPPGKGAAAGDLTGALAKAEGAVKAATEARDALAAMLPPQPDPAAVQAGAVGAPVNALLDANPAAHAAPPAPPAQVTLPMTPQSPTFAPALGQQIDVWMKGGVQHAEVQLSPQELGPIRVRIEMMGDQTRVQMSADVQSTRDALQQAMPQLSEQLGQVGLSLSGGGVSDQPTFRQSQAQAQADGGFGGGGRSGGGHASASQGGGLEDIAAASAARQLAQRRGLLDLYA
jgi:flagellar hook-length control protein FliK